MLEYGKVIWMWEHNDHGKDPQNGSGCENVSRLGDFLELKTIICWGEFHINVKLTILKWLIQ